MAKNIRFHYLYRDSGNYKKFGHKDFSNPDQLPVEQVRLELEQRLIDRSFFYPEAVGIKKFKFHRFCDDYSWYEVETIEEVNSGKCGMNKEERLNPANGICLSAHFDTAFDRGYLYFDNDFRMIIGPKLKQYATQPYSFNWFKQFEGRQMNLPVKHLPSQEFLEWHREFACYLV